MNIHYLNKFSLVTYNLHNGNVTFKKIKKNNEEVTNDIINKNNSFNQENELDQNNVSFNSEPINKEYWVIKNKNNKFKILIKSQDLEITTLMYIKAGPFSTLEDAKEMLNIITKWGYSDVI